MNEHAKTNGYATREQLLSPGKRRYKDVDLPVSGLKVRIRSLFEHESEAFLAEGLTRGQLNKGAAVSSYRRLIVRCLVGGDNEPLLTAADMDCLNQWDSADINHCGRESEAHCGFMPGELEKSEKNSQAVLGDS